ncbi:hypothetical protein VUR80DRAFT_549 [Thermomyces stellatus]
MRLGRSNAIWMDVMDVIRRLGVADVRARGACHLSHDTALRCVRRKAKDRHPSLLRNCNAALALVAQLPHLASPRRGGRCRTRRPQRREVRLWRCSSCLARARPSVHGSLAPNHHLVSPSLLVESRDASSGRMLPIQRRDGPLLEEWHAGTLFSPLLFMTLRPWTWVVRGQGGGCIRAASSRGGPRLHMLACSAEIFLPKRDRDPTAAATSTNYF